MSEVILKNKFEKGQELKYRSRTEINNRARDKEKDREIGTQNATWEIEIRQRILDVEEGEKAHILYYSSPVSVPVEAQMMGVLNKKQVIYVFMNSFGKIIEASGIGFQGIVNFPEKAIKTGESWTETSEIELPGFPQGVQHSRTFTLENIEKVNDYECATINVTAKDTELEIPTPDRRSNVKYIVRTSGKIHFAHKEGFLVKSSIETSFTSFYGNTVMEGSNRFEQELLEIKAKVSA
jgi:hypothetical protein